MSHKTGLPRLLIYKNQDKMGSSSLWAGINYDDHTDRPPSDLDLVLLDSDVLIFNTNFLGPADTKNPSIAKTCQIANATLSVKADKIEELSKHKLTVNTITKSGIQQSFIPLSHFFLHKDEQNGSGGIGIGTWWHWLIMITCFALIYAAIWKFGKREIERRQKLREETLCNNLGDQLQF